MTLDSKLSSHLPLRGIAMVGRGYAHPRARSGGLGGISCGMRCDIYIPPEKVGEEKNLHNTCSTKPPFKPTNARIQLHLFPRASRCSSSTKPTTICTNSSTSSLPPSRSFRSFSIAALVPCSSVHSRSWVSCPPPPSTLPLPLPLLPRPR